MMTPNVSPSLLGKFLVAQSGTFEVASYQTFDLTVELGVFGMDDKGSVRFVFHGAKDYSEPQTEDPTAPGYVTARTSSGKALEVAWHPFLSERPWFNTLEVRLVEGGLRPGDKIFVTLGDTSQGSPGFRMQTYCQDEFKFRAMINPFSTQQFREMEQMPTITVGPTVAHRLVAVLPTVRQVGEKFRLSVKAEDIWGNPTDKTALDLTLTPSLPVHGLPATAQLEAGKFALILEDIKTDQAGDLTISVTCPKTGMSCQTNPLRIQSERSHGHFWGDLHGQSGETIGTNSAWRYFEFARDKAFMDICSHQGNDFQISDAFWQELNNITREFDAPGRFLAIPGYEWSGNSTVGGDRNIWFRSEGEVIRRAHRALVDEAENPETDCHTAQDLFDTFVAEGTDVAVGAHCGGRYADITVAHDGRVENSVEIHSAWGTFEWILQDAFDCHHRVGIVGQSDGHKGRPGASYPGQSFFTSKGGYTCYLMNALTRDELFGAMRSRRHYGTTGTRLYMSVQATFDNPAKIYHQDPAVFGTDVGCDVARVADMGDIVQLASGEDRVWLNVDVTGSAPIERLDILDAGKVIETLQPNVPDGSTKRVRVIWRGAKYRGRGRNMPWREGCVQIEGNEIEQVTAVNFWGPEVQPVLETAHSVVFEGLTAGNLQGLDLMLAKSGTGVLKFSTQQVEFELDLAHLKPGADHVVDVEGLGADVRVSLIDETRNTTKARHDFEISLDGKTERRLFARVTQTDGHQAWSSPIYLLP
ncbi:DUF3604 domain-containing protein [Ruegeria sp. 2012CJ41-6]|uniref:DUF3604 domain-containing protein n=1 Tax=Ruegeria spongiae TaxID=2942209 RepID=A0ABT0Q857_9RHOB|nr:DUF3604 domain-containing protein [Ruegeria spongiae]MCL6285602.1 DUF3604 domain-containing protein [Ruegeria spongiae]